MVKVTHHYSACVTIETPDVKILCDPWFTDGIYDGSWFLYPKPENEPTEADVIYISHIHPDHYDPVFLKRKFPHTKIIVQDRDPNYLVYKLQHDGFSFRAINSIRIGMTEIFILPDFGTIYNIDSVLIVKHGNESVINLNDCNPTPEFVKMIKQVCPDPTLAMIGHAGASAHPQVYYDVHDPRIEVAARGKYKRRLTRYLALANELGAKVNLAFAGQYLLGGKLYYLNPYRGIGDDVDVMAYDPRSIVLNEGGTIDLSSLSVEGARYTPFHQDRMQEYALSLSSKSYRYEGDPFWMGYTDLFKRAFQNAMEKSPVRPEIHICIKHMVEGNWLCMLPGKNKIQEFDSVESISPRWEAYPDVRLLHGCLTKKYHWNNVYVGSLFPIRLGTEEEFDDTPVTAFLNFFHA